MQVQSEQHNYLHATQSQSMPHQYGQYTHPQYKLDPELNISYRAITGCLKPTHVDDLYLLAGIAPPDIRRGVCAHKECTNQVSKEVQSLFRHIPPHQHLMGEG